MQNRKLLDDLNEGDVVEADLGQMLVRGNFLRFKRNTDGKWFLVLMRAGGQLELVLTCDIEKITKKY